MPLPKFLKIKKMVASDVIVDGEGRPDATFLRSQNDNLDNLRRIINSLVEQVTDITTALEMAGIAIATAEEVKAQNALAASYVDPVGCLSAAASTADPTKAKITVAAHTRKYADGTTAAIAGGEIDLLDFGAFYYVTYLDAARAGGTFAFTATTDIQQAGQEGDRHCVGSVYTPATSADPPMEGGGPRPPGVPWQLPRPNMEEV